MNAASKSAVHDLLGIWDLDQPPRDLVLDLLQLAQEGGARPRASSQDPHTIRLAAMQSVLDATEGVTAKSLVVDLAVEGLATLGVVAREPPP